MRLFLSLFALGLIMIIGVASSTITAMSNTLFTDSLLDEQEIYTLKVMQNDTGAWYYHILKNQKTLIIQKSIPAISGNRAFIDSLQAARVGGLVIYKLSGGIFPPGISKKELDSLQIIM